MMVSIKGKVGPINWTTQSQELQNSAKLLS